VAAKWPARPGVRAAACAGCGCRYDDRTAGCESCEHRHYQRGLAAAAQRAPHRRAVERASELDLTRLPVRLQAIAATLGSMLAEDYSRAEIARYYGRSRSWVTGRLNELREGIVRLVEEAPRDGDGG